MLPTSVAKKIIIKYLARGTGVLVSEDFKARTGGGELLLLLPTFAGEERSISWGEENSRILAATPLKGEGFCWKRRPKAGDDSLPPPPAGSRPVITPPRLRIRFTFGLNNNYHLLS